jgi:hypothetical protein
MRKLILTAIIFIALSCKKNNSVDTTTPVVITKCGAILKTPTLDSFVYPTYYITMHVAFKEGTEIVHLHGNVSGAHDGSWFLTTYDKDTIYCKTIITL